MQTPNGSVRVRGAREQTSRTSISIPRVRWSSSPAVRLGQVLARSSARCMPKRSGATRIGLAVRAAAVPSNGRTEVDEIDGLPPAVALQQQRGSPTTRSSVGSVTTLSNLLRMLYSRAGEYPPEQPHLEAEVLAEHAGRRVSAMPRPGQSLRRDRARGPR